ncbi:MAG: AraC family transcriptional regulator [Cytophagales bacterium]|nr:AraC family transcriptional regulator [Cytophagales bacterium]
MSEIIHIKSLDQFYAGMKAPKPPHPLISVIRKWPKMDFDSSNLKMVSDLYYMGMKTHVTGGFKYGRGVYDYEEGTLVFIGAGQVYSLSNQKPDAQMEGWTIMFHPDLIRKYELGKKIKNYSFFRYEISEALHLPLEERQFLSALVDSIEREIIDNKDQHAEELIVQNLSTILMYCDRYYGSQFHRRSQTNEDVVTKFQDFLEVYFNSSELSEAGLPSIDTCGKELNMSGAYLSDLLRIQTGKSAKDHIHGYLIEQAKNKLLNSRTPVTHIALGFGFKYPQNFTKLFKAKTGLSPNEYRKTNE